MGDVSLECPDEEGKKWVRTGPLCIEIPGPDATAEELNRIIGVVINDYKQLLPQGIPEIDLPPCDPFFLDEMVIERRGIKGLVAINSYSTDVNFHGISSFSNEKFILDPTKRQMEFSIDIPQVFLAGNYTMGGSILFIPVKGQGTFAATVESVCVTGVAFLKIQGEIVQVDKVQLQLEIFGKIEFEILGLFKQNSWLDSLINTLINQNAHRLFNELKPELEEKTKDILIAIANASLKALPFLINFLKQD